MAIVGATVCRLHGGAAPQVKEKARLRLLEAADPAAALLVTQMKNKGLDDNVRQKAALAILDRAGLSPTSKHEHTGANGGPIQVAPVDLSKYDLSKLETLAELVEAGAEEQKAAEPVDS